jgi:hypothetical protein
VRVQVVVLEVLEAELPDLLLGDGFVEVLEDDAGGRDRLVGVFEFLYFLFLVFEEHFVVVLVHSFLRLPLAQ